MIDARAEAARRWPSESLRDSFKEAILGPRDSERRAFIAGAEYGAAEATRPLQEALREIRELASNDRVSTAKRIAARALTSSATPKGDDS